MPESGRRVVLLARPGPARDRVRAALAEVGAELALEADPTQAGVDDLAAAHGEVVIVVLDVAAEAALARFDAVLLDPAIDVLYEEADLAAQRSGWDAARWTRHLAAKVHRHRDVLPPGRAPAEADAADAAAEHADPDAGGRAIADAPAGTRPAGTSHGAWAPDAPDTPAAAADMLDVRAAAAEIPQRADASTVEAPAFDTFATAMHVDPVAPAASEAPSLALDLDWSASSADAPAAAHAGADAFDAVPKLPEVSQADTAPSDAPLELEWTATGFDASAAADAGVAAFGFDALELTGTAAPHPLSDEFTPGVEPGGYRGFDPVAAEMTELEFNADQVIAFDPGLDEHFAAPAGPAAPTAPAFDLAFEREFSLPEIHAPVDAAPVHVPDEVGHRPATPPLDLPSPDFDVRPHAADDAERAPFAGLSDGHVLALVTDDAPIATPAPSPSAPRLADLEARIAAMSLVEDAPAATGGAVLLVAGLGGPDAVRQVLGALPEGFPRPVLVQQRLEGGRYDRLVTQLQRATAMPVDLADVGAQARPGVVYVLPEGIGLFGAEDGLRFDGGDPLDALPPADSAVLLLSGADAALADRIASAPWSPALVAGQAADGCYDATASHALAALGRPTAAPTELARQLVERWVA